MAPPRALENIRVVDFTWVRAGPWATRWLGAFGAEIIKIEWPENERGRLPSTTTPQDLEVNLNTSGNFNDTNVNKKSLSLNVRSAKGLEIVKRLIAVSDIVIENFSSRVLRNWGLGYDELRNIKPDIVYVSMSGYGHSGRHHHYTTFGPVAQAVSGLTYMSGLPDQPPAGWGWSYMDDTGGMYGAMCALTGLYHRKMTGQGQHIDLSQMVSSVPLAGPVLLDFTVNGRGARRAGYPPGNRAHWPGTPLANNYRGPTVAPHNAYRTNPGEYNDWCVIVCHSDAEWQRLVQVMGAPSWATGPEFATVSGRLRHQQELDDGIEAWTMTLGKYEVTERCQAAGVRALPVQSAEDRVEHDPQLRHREMYLPIEHPALGAHKVQNAPFKLSETPASNHLPSPLIGEHTREIVEGLLGYSHGELCAGFADGTFWPTGRARFAYMEEMLPVTNAEPLAGPLAGLRILELADETGQFCGKLLGDFGADVVKIEPPGGEPSRHVGPFLDDIPDPHRSLSFWYYNTSKRGITLNLKTADGSQLFRRLAATADVILETFRPGLLASLGLGYESLREQNAGLILCALTPFGQTGPWRDYLSSDLLHMAAGGEMASSGYDAADVPNAPPIAPGGGNAWHMGCHFAYIAIVAALVHRTATGQGQYIDASIHDACALTTEAQIANYIYRGEVLLRQTGRHHAAAPTSRTQFRAKDGVHVCALVAGRLNPRYIGQLADLLDTSGMAGDLRDPKYRDPAVIAANTSHIIDGLVADFIASLPAEEVYHRAQERGFTWGAVRAPEATLDDPHLHDRGFWKDVEHPELGRSFVYPGEAAIYNASPWRISRRAPLIGEHNTEIFCHELGLSRGELAVLAENRVI